ncbi:MAG: hypothetical protein K2N41_06200, partial [Lachnospiraceae bacterium]|nr:hypothetical protein [Lachnospiraceae bacterium]
MEKKMNPQNEESGVEKKIEFQEEGSAEKIMNPRYGEIVAEEKAEAHDAKNGCVKNLKLEGE